MTPVDALGDPLDPGLNPPCPTIPFLLRQAGEPGEPSGKPGPFGAPPCLFGRQALRIFALGGRGPRSGRPAEPRRMGRLFQPAVVDRQGKDLFVARQDRAVSGEDATPHAGKAVATHQRPGCVGSERGPLSDLELHRPTENP